jgi:hypothetical protein
MAMATRATAMGSHAQATTLVPDALDAMVTEESEDQWTHGFSFLRRSYTAWSPSLSTSSANLTLAASLAVVGSPSTILRPLHRSQGTRRPRHCGHALMACELGSHASVDLLQAGADKRVVARLDAALEAVVAGEDFEIGIRLGEGMDAFVVAVVAVHVTLLVVLLGLLPPHRLS